MLAYGNATFGYTATGSLRWKAENVDTTRYYYDLMGNLVSVGMPDGTQIQYMIDGQNRRVGKILNGRVVKRWLYQNHLNIVAELDSLGNVAGRFIYGSKGHVPDYMVKNGITYQFITDHLGSVRFVVDVASGAVVQYISYGEFGNILTDTNPGFQPFGYAGGLYDKDTERIRFGFRDYDVMSGRWTLKDPIGFISAYTNLYCYVNNNPLNFMDYWGLYGKEVHSALTEKWAVEAGFSPEEAKMIAMADQSIDDRFMTHSFNPFGFNRHFPNREKVKEKLENINCGDLQKLGELLHSLQDSFSHEGFDASTIGHFPDQSVDKYNPNSGRDWLMEANTRYYLHQYVLKYKKQGE